MPDPSAPAAEAKSTVENQLEARARALLAELLDIQQSNAGVYGGDEIVSITEALRAERERALEEALTAVEAQRLDNPDRSDDEEMGYEQGLDECGNAISALREAKP